jgi:hypothetical protein
MFPSWWHKLDNESMVVVKMAVALVGAAVLVWFFLAERLPDLRRGRRVREGLLALLGIVSCACWWNLGRYHFNGVVHYYEFYHYYLGAKYAPELGYTRIYDCTLAAESEIPDVRPRLETLQVRDLTNNVLTSATAMLERSAQSKERFTPARWKEFVHDSDFFRRSSTWTYWSSALKDHGYNATPVWRIAAGALANQGPISDSRLHALASIDPILLLAALIFIVWAFGWRTACVCALFWGTNYPGRYWWTGGAFLRMDWLLAMVAGICFMKKGRPFAAGASIALATLLRVFPGFLVAALLLKIAVESVRTRRLAVTLPQRRFLLGGVVATALLVPIATWSWGSMDCWPGFVENSRKHLSTPLTNDMGLKTLVAFSYEARAEVTKRPVASDPFAEWKHLQREHFDRRYWVYLLALGAFLVVLGRAVARHEDWVALVLGVGLILFAADLTCYYFTFLLALGTLWTLGRWSGVPLALASAVSCWIPNHWLNWDDVRYVAITVVYLVLVVGITSTLGWIAGPAGRTSPRSHRDVRNSSTTWTNRSGSS